MQTKVESRDEAEALYEACRGSPDVSKKAFEIWDSFSLKEVRVAKTPQQVIEALKRCPPEGPLAGNIPSVARNLALAKLAKVQDSLVEKIRKTRNFDQARKLYYALPGSSYLKRELADICRELATVAAGTIKDLDSAVRVLRRYGSFNDKVYKLANKRWGEYAMVEAKKAKTIEQARRAYLRARQSKHSAARKFLEKKFFTPPSPK